MASDPTLNKQETLKACMHEIFQIVLHFDELKDYLLSEKIEIYFDTPQIIQNFISLLSCYKRVYEENNNNEDKIQSINNQSFIDDLSKTKYLQIINNPIDILDIIFKLIHSYIASKFSKDSDNPINSQQICEPNCIIHKLFLININEYEKCLNCTSSRSFQMNPNYFIYQIKINTILDRVKENNFAYQEISNNLFNISSMIDKKCLNCKFNKLEKNIIWYSLQKYFIIALNWKKVDPNRENLIKIYCMINSEIKPQNESKEDNLDGLYLFKGLLLKKSKIHKYASVFYEEKSVFRLYYFTKIKNFQNWNELISKLIDSSLYPIAIIYENKKNEELKFFIEENNYYKLKEKKIEKIENDNNSNKKSDLDTPNPCVDWTCNICNKKNNFNDKICIHCNKNEKENIENEKIEGNEIKNDDEDEKKSIEKWVCLICKNENLKTDNKCRKCGRKNGFSKNQTKTWLCNKCQQVNKDNNEKCAKCGNINFSIKQINHLINKANQKKNKDEVNDINNINEINDNKNEIDDNKNEISDNNNINEINDNKNEINDNNNINEINDNKIEINDDNNINEINEQKDNFNNDFKLISNESEENNDDDDFSKEFNRDYHFNPYQK